MKRVTKKLVKEALASFTGWQFSYNFKESNRIILFGRANENRIVEHLKLYRVVVLEHIPQDPWRTGSMKLGLLI